MLFPPPREHWLPVPASQVGLGGARGWLQAGRVPGRPSRALCTALPCRCGEGRGAAGSEGRDSATPPASALFLMRLRRVSWPSAPLRTFLLACTERCTARACFSPLRKFALLGSALVKASKRVRKGISFSLRGLQLSKKMSSSLPPGATGGHRGPPRLA